jgi:HPt (histidine-containing phosphotransfer) domain-containing protein
LHPNQTLLALSVPLVLAIIGLVLMGDALLKGRPPMNETLTQLQTALVAADADHTAKAADAGAKEAAAVEARRLADTAHQSERDARSGLDEKLETYIAALRAQYGRPS